jgi:hypothetical protein
MIIPDLPRFRRPIWSSATCYTNVARTGLHLCLIADVPHIGVGIKHEHPPALDPTYFVPHASTIYCLSFFELVPANQVPVWHILLLLSHNDPVRHILLQKLLNLGRT